MISYKVCEFEGQVLISCFTHELAVTQANRFSRCGAVIIIRVDSETINISFEGELYSKEKLK